MKGDSQTKSQKRYGGSVFEKQRGRKVRGETVRMRSGAERLLICSDIP